MCTISFLWLAKTQLEVTTDQWWLVAGHRGGVACRGTWGSFGDDETLLYLGGGGYTTVYLSELRFTH